jgi:hypothetical protein
VAIPCTRQTASLGFRLRLEPVPHPETRPLFAIDPEPRLSEFVQDRGSRTESDEFEDLPLSRDDRDRARSCKPPAREDDPHVGGCKDDGLTDVRVSRLRVVANHAALLVRPRREVDGKYT